MSDKVFTYTEEQQKIVDHIIKLEKDALDLWFKGDTSGYREIWSQKSFSYYDANTTERIDTYEDICKFLDSVHGKLFADSYDFVDPRVQFGQDIAILTYQLFSKTNLINMQYNVIEIFQKEEDDWKVIHSTWAFIRPRYFDFSSIKKLV
ncbi:hypothetical protein CKF54_07240 [Psittacicella hinzii]|uniref:DUF4440 domain-containing protein n=1 Tax=Psittacicella hinzii TaxID=2028575 RepID=A0A3A1Y597_9GAMM|nr:DUF4440 domain-containing protein [Psittacicella hinzii]RIY31204.1 hypothetical protein CKF54_07240 [Psittacicella hinzii]